MELKEIVEGAERTHDISQNELARKIGLQPSALSHVLNKRRKLPAEAAIELSELTGLRAKEVWEAAKRWGNTAACVALAVVTLFVTAPLNNADAAMTYVSGVPANTNYGGFWGWVRVYASRMIAKAKRQRRAVQDSLATVLRLWRCEGPPALA